MPDSAACIAAFRTAESWLRAGAVPADPINADPAGATGVCITLRHAGAVLGRETVMLAEESHENAPAASAGALVWTAMTRAVAQARQRAPAPNDATRAETLAGIFAAISLDMQFAGRLAPILGDSFDDAGLQINAGVEGAAVRLGPSVRAFFPGVMLATHATPARALAAACADLGLPPATPARHRAERAAVLYRFPVQHLVQTNPGEPPVFLYRGGRVLPEIEVSIPTIRAGADRIAAHLLTRAWPERGGGDSGAGVPPALGLMGDYEPITDKHEPLIAPPAQQALAAIALADYASLDRAARPKDALALAKRIVRDLRTQEPQEADPLASPVTAAAFVLAALGAGELDLGNAFDARAVEGARAAFTDSDWSADILPAQRALIALALVRLSAVANDAPVSRDTARAAVQTLLKETEPGALVALMPWLGFACLELDPVVPGTPAGAPLPELPARDALLDLYDLVKRHQITRDDLGEDSPDLIGGIVFSAARNPLPTWQSARPIAFFGRALGDPRLTPREALPERLSTLVKSWRYLLQLVAGEPECHMFRDRDRCLGGVREAPWSQRMPLDASAMTLLALTEASRTMERLNAGK